MRTRHEDLEVAAKGTASSGPLLCSPAHGDVVALVDASGNVKASYSYDAFGALTSSSETLANGWSNPYRFDGAELVRYDPETNLYWMRVRAYDPTLGRFISHDPLGRLAVQGLDTQPYVYASNNPVNQTDPTGLYVPRGPLHDDNPDTNGCLPGEDTPGCPMPEIPSGCKGLTVHQCTEGTRNQIDAVNYYKHSAFVLTLLSAGINLIWLGFRIFKAATKVSFDFERILDVLESVMNFFAALRFTRLSSNRVNHRPIAVSPDVRCLPKKCITRSR